MSFGFKGIRGLLIDKLKSVLFGFHHAKLFERRCHVVSSVESKRIRSPILCVLGHVDVGKTLLLDKIRGTATMFREVGAMMQRSSGGAAW
ncbi:MAG: hypothetical protein QXD66_03285 [Candidatus Nezhaarchaeales archaeon]